MGRRGLPVRHLVVTALWCWLPSSLNNRSGPLSPLRPQFLLLQDHTHFGGTGKNSNEMREDVWHRAGSQKTWVQGTAPAGPAFLGSRHQASSAESRGTPRSVSHLAQGPAGPPPALGAPCTFPLSAFICHRAPGSGHWAVSRSSFRSPDLHV